MTYSCEECGAHLDPGESCSCGGKIKREAHRGNGNASHKNEINIRIVSHNEKNVNPLRRFRIENNIPANEMVETIKAIYPGYDKPLHSKVEHGEQYGIELRQNAIRALEKRFCGTIKKKDHHKGFRVSCRLDADTYAAFMAQLDKEKITMQEWISCVIRKELENELVRNR